MQPLDAVVVDARLRELTAAWAADPDIAAIWVFGSRASGRPRPWSDIDLAVALASGLDAKRRSQKHGELLADACARLGTDAVDLVVLEDAPSVLAHRVIAGGRRLAVRDSTRTVHVVEDVFRRYIDEAPLRAVLDAGLAARLREGRYAG
ncbi:MAG TPA: nucleotidyltransferase domain-containing protein [Nannocystaceae bacterium]|nr:nucleotidyltransferase domain-containing protein [Nannocystaceae bacterium]